MDGPALLKHHEEAELVIWAWNPGRRPDGTMRTLPPHLASGICRCNSYLGRSRHTLSKRKIKAMATYQLNVNGAEKTVDVDPSTPLLWVLREELKMTGTKYGCGISACGACTVHVDGVATRSCVVPVSLIGERQSSRLKRSRNDPVGRAVQNAWVEKDVVQCGYCQSGQIMSAVALLKATPKPTDTNIEESMGGNLCRCATYVRIREAIESASQQLKGGATMRTSP